jgi:formiminotetrahydrofolate cyclodeaminase
MNVRINLKNITDKTFCTDCVKRAEKTLADVRAQCRNVVDSTAKNL